MVHNVNPEIIAWGGKQVGVRAIRTLNRYFRGDGLLDVHCDLFDPRVISPKLAKPTIPFVVQSVTNEMIADHRFFSWHLYPQLEALVRQVDS